MKLSNFKVEEIDKTRLFKQKIFATVDVTTGNLWWRKTVTRRIMREFAGFYRFLDTGGLTPGDQAEELERRYAVTSGVSIWD